MDLAAMVIRRGIEILDNASEMSTDLDEQNARAQTHKILGSDHISVGSPLEVTTLVAMEQKYQTSRDSAFKDFRKRLAIKLGAILDICRLKLLTTHEVGFHFVVLRNNCDSSIFKTNRSHPISIFGSTTGQ